MLWLAGYEYLSAVEYSIRADPGPWIWMPLRPRAQFLREIWMVSYLDDWESQRELIP